MRLSPHAPARRGLTLLLALAAGLGPTASDGATAVGPGDLDHAAAEWLRADSEHFVLFGDAARGDLETVATTLERLREVLIALAPQTRVGAGPPTHIYLFRDDVSFRPFRISSVEAGYLVPGDDRSYAAFSGGSPSPLVIKQYVLELLHRHLPGLPPWLRDGLAEYYSTFEADAGEARLGLPQQGHLFFFTSERAGTTGGGLRLLAAEPDPEAGLAPCRSGCRC